MASTWGNHSTQTLLMYHVLWEWWGEEGRRGEKAGEKVVEMRK
jgi:hypothetical protein